MGGYHDSFVDFYFSVFPKVLISLDIFLQTTNVYIFILVSLLSVNLSMFLSEDMKHPLFSVLSGWRKYRVSDTLAKV